MSLQYSPKITTDGLVMCLDASQNKSYPTSDLPVKDGLLLWLDASDDSTFSYSSGTEVSQWRDKSGNNFHANELQAVGNKPSRNTVVNGRKSLNFTSTEGDRLRVNSGMVFTNSVTAIVFIKPGSQNYAYANILDQDHAMSGQANGWVIQRNNVSSAWQSWVSNSAGDNWFNPNQVSYTDNTPQIVTLRKGSSTITLYNNGTTSGDVSVADQQIRQANYFGLNIGSWRAGGFSDRHYNGEICEIVVYNRALSLTELKQVHTYLGQKWGISNTDRCVFDLSGNGFDFVFNGANPRYNAKTFVSNFNTTSPFAVSSYGGQNLTSNILNLLYSDHTIEVAFNAKGFRSVYSYDNTLTTQDGQSIVIWTGRHSGLRVFQNTIIYEYWNTQSSTVGISVSISSYIDKIIYITATRTGDVLRLYINGVLLSGPTTVAATTSPVSYSQINIGAAYQGNPTTQGYIWAGQHEYHLLRMYGRRLSDSEVASNYQAFKARFDNNIVRFGLVMELDAGNPYSYGGAGTVWYDVSGNSYNGTLIGSPSYTSTNNGGIIFDSNAKYGTLPTSGLAFGTGQFAIEAWIFSTAAVTNNIIYASQSSNVAGFIALYYVNGSGFALTDFNAVGVRTTTTHQTAVSQNTWYHVVGVRNASNQYIVYVNGVVSTTNATSSATLSASAPQIASNPATTGERFTGTMASLRLYTRQLSAAEVLQNYNATKGRFGL
jgi:hypothetical protein